MKMSYIRQAVAQRVNERLQDMGYAGYGGLVRFRADFGEDLGMVYTTIQIYIGRVRNAKPYPAMRRGNQARGDEDPFTATELENLSNLLYFLRIDGEEPLIRALKSIYQHFPYPPESQAGQTIDERLSRLAPEDRQALEGLVARYGKIHS